MLLDSNNTELEDLTLTRYKEISTVMLNLLAIKVTNVIRGLGNISTCEIVKTMYLMYTTSAWIFMPMMVLTSA